MKHEADLIENRHAAKVEALRQGLRAPTPEERLRAAEEATKFVRSLLDIPRLRTGSSRRSRAIRIVSTKDDAGTGAADNEDGRMDRMDLDMIDHMEALLNKAFDDPDSPEGRAALAEALSNWQAFAAAFRDGVARGQALPEDKREAFARMVDDLQING